MCILMKTCFTKIQYHVHFLMIDRSVKNTEIKFFLLPTYLALP